METCKCTVEEKKSLGNRWVTVDGERVRKCNNCDLIANDDAVLLEVKELAKPTTPLGKRLSGIDDIVKRMWIWISIQAVLIGFWLGDAFGTPHMDYYGNISKDFNGGTFVIGTLVGFGAFAPLVFVVQALKEVVINLVKGPLDKSELD